MDRIAEATREGLRQMAAVIMRDIKRELPEIENAMSTVFIDDDRLAEQVLKFSNQFGSLYYLLEIRDALDKRIKEDKKNNKAACAF